MNTNCISEIIVHICYITGLPNTFGDYDETPRMMADKLEVSTSLSFVIIWNNNVSTIKTTSRFY